MVCTFHRRWFWKVSARRLTQYLLLVPTYPIFAPLPVTLHSCSCLSWASHAFLSQPSFFGQLLQMMYVLKRTIFVHYWVFFLCLKELQTAFPEIWTPVSFVGWLLFFTLRISHRKWNLPIKLHCSSLYQGLQIKTPNHIFNYINQHVTGILAWLPYIRPVNK